MLLELLTAFVSPALLSLLLTPWVIALAARVRALDQPDERKVHGKPMLLLGGIAVFCSFFLAVPLTHLLYPRVFLDLGLGPHLGKTIIVSCGFMLMLGIWDDLRPLSAENKLIVQLLIGTIVYAGGVKISEVTNPIGGGTLVLGIAAYPVTLLWIVGITNALNLVDGLDGLASGVSGIAAMTICAISLLRGDIGTALMAIVLAGAVIGFLPYNFHPAKIFLGDSGSLFLGFVLAILSILGSAKGLTTFALSVPVLALGFPIVDTLLAIVRRALRPFSGRGADRQNGRFSLNAIFLPDREHIHHRLLALGLSHRDAVLLLYVISGSFGCAAIAQSLMTHFAAMLITMIAGGLAIVGVWRLQYREMALFKNDVFLTLYNRSPLRKGWVQAIGDTLFAGFAYTVCYGLVRGFRFVAADAENFIPKALVVASVQIMICWFSGFYRGEGRLYGPGTFFRVFRTVTFATVTSELILLYLGRRFDFLDFFALLLDYFALFSFFLVTGLTYRALAHLSRGGHGLRTMIIYGAGNFGRAYLDALVASNDRGLIPIGFIDDNGTAGGSSIQGYPVHGSMSDILPLLRRMQVDEIHIAMAHPSPDAVLRLKQATRGYPVLLKQVAFAHERFSTEEIEEHTTDNS